MDLVRQFQVGFCGSFGVTLHEQSFTLPQFAAGFVQILERSGKSWNLKYKFSRSWKASKMTVGMEKYGKMLENCDADWENELISSWTSLKNQSDFCTTPVGSGVWVPQVTDCHNIELFFKVSKSDVDYERPWRLWKWYSPDAWYSWLASELQNSLELGPGIPRWEIPSCWISSHHLCWKMVPWACRCTMPVPSRVAAGRKIWLLHWKTDTENGLVGFMGNKMIFWSLWMCEVVIEWQISWDYLLYFYAQIDLYNIIISR